MAGESFAPAGSEINPPQIGGSGSSTSPVSSVFGRTGAVVAGNTEYLAVATGGLTGAVSATRYVGGTASVAPTSGTFAVGDHVITQTGHVYVCTVAGSPGTWVDAGSVGNAVSSVFGRTGAVALTAADVEALFTATGQMFQGTGSGTGTLALPPGYTINYTEIISNVTVSATSEGTPTAIVSSGAITYDGTAIDIEFCCGEVDTGSGGQVIFNLWDGASELGYLAVITPPSGVLALPVLVKRRLTPSAGAHTYQVQAWRTVANGTVKAGAGSSGTNMPTYIKVTKA